MLKDFQLPDARQTWTGSLLEPITALWGWRLITSLNPRLIREADPQAIVLWDIVPKDTYKGQIEKFGSMTLY